MASLTWGAGGGPPAYATVRINRDGTIEVLTGAQDLGTGARTVFAQIAAEVLGARLEDVRTILGDTERLPFASNSWGSITTASVGPAVRVAAEEARDSLFEAAAEHARTAASSDLEVARQRDSRDTTTDRCMLFARRLREARRRDDHRPGEPRAESREDGDRRRSARSSPRWRSTSKPGECACCASSSAHDSGRIINPTLAESQLEGGIIQGLGLRAVRGARAGRSARRAAQSDDARLQDSDDRRRAGDRRVLRRRRGSSSRITRARRVWRSRRSFGVAPAIANAVADALGVEVTETPLTPWRVGQAARQLDG